MKKIILIAIIVLTAGFSFSDDILAGECAPGDETFPSDKKPMLVEVYTLPDCPFCKKTRQFFSDNKIEFIEYDISTSTDNRKRFNELDSRGVPLIFIDGNRILGYNEDTLKRAIINLD